MKNLINPFVFLHTHVLTQSLLEQTIDFNIPVEIDISIDERGPYVGHPDSWYDFHGKLRPSNLVDIATLTELLRLSTTPYVIDLKDRDAYLKTKKLIQNIGVERCVLHVFAESLAFNVFESDREPHRQQEDIPDEIIIDAKENLGVSVIASSRGMNLVHDSETIMNAVARLAPYIDVYSGYIDEAQYSAGLEDFFLSHNIGILKFVDKSEELIDARIMATNSFHIAALANGKL